MEKNQETPKWLTELQQKSWEPEILLSGIVLYGMFNMPELLDRGLIFVRSNIWGQTSDINTMVSVLKVATYWLIGGLLLHLISRGIWVGMVGLSYAFPRGINHSNLNYYGKFEQKVRRIPDFKQIINNLEKICSSLFSISFMLFMMMIGAYLCIAILILPIFFVLLTSNSLEGTTVIVFTIYTNVVIGIGIVALIDFVTLGYFRRFKWVAKILWPIHRLVSAITLSRFYRPIYYGLVSNLNKWGVFAFVFIFALVNILMFGRINSNSPESSFSLITYWSNQTGYGAFSGYYDDQNSERYSVRASIPSDIIDENVLRLFIVADVNREDSIQAYGERIIPPEELDSLASTEKNYRMVKQFYHVYLDDSLLEEYPFKFHYKSHTRQLGYLIYLDINDLPSGMFELKVGGPPVMYGETKWATIPFYRDKRDFENEVKDLLNGRSAKEGIRSIKPLIVE